MKIIKIFIILGLIINLFACEKKSVYSVKKYSEFENDFIYAKKTNNLLEINKDLNNIREEIYTKITEAFDAWNEKIVDNIEKIEKLNKVLNSYQNIIDIVGINTLKIDDKFMKNLSNAIVDNSKKVLDASVKKYKSLHK